MLRREAQLLVNYRNSPLAGDGDGGVERGPRPGDRAPDCRGLQRAAVNHPLRLFELLADPDHTLLLYADDAGQLPAFAEIEDLVTTASGGRAKTYVTTATPEPSGPQRTDDRGRRGRVPDHLRRYRRQWLPGAAGGGYLGFRATPIGTAALRNHLERVFAAQTPTHLSW